MKRTKRKKEKELQRIGQNVCSQCHKDNLTHANLISFVGRKWESEGGREGGESYYRNNKETKTRTAVVKVPKILVIRTIYINYDKTTEVTSGGLSNICKDRETIR